MNCYLYACVKMFLPFLLKSSKAFFLTADCDNATAITFVEGRMSVGLRVYIRKEGDVVLAIQASEVM